MNCTNPSSAGNYLPLTIDTSTLEFLPVFCDLARECPTNEMLNSLHFAIECCLPPSDHGMAYQRVCSAWATGCNEEHRP